MTDKDILERLKNYVAECRKDGFPMLRSDVALIFFDEAIQEVERLRLRIERLKEREREARKINQKINKGYMEEVK